MRDYIKWWVEPKSKQIVPVDGEHYDDLPIDYYGHGGDDHWVRVGYSDTTETMYAEGYDLDNIRAAVSLVIRREQRPRYLDVETRDGEFFQKFSGIDVVAFANGIDNLNEWALVESRDYEDIEQYIRMNHINDLSTKTLFHLFKLDGGDRLGQTDYDIAPISRFDKSDLYQEELHFWFNGTTLEKAAEGFYGPRGVELAKIAAKKIFADFSKIEKQHPDAKLYMNPLGYVVKLSGQSTAMKAIVKRRFGVAANSMLVIWDR